ncbi:hypothetical protein V1280_001372 [Bradyrhizobium sp. AZCC 2230]
MLLWIFIGVVVLLLGLFVLGVRHVTRDDEGPI